MSMGGKDKEEEEEEVSMDPDPEDIEEQYNNAVFQVGDARERYPKRCAEELGRYLEIKNKIAMEPVVLKPSPQIFEIAPSADIRDRKTTEEGSNTRHALGNGTEHLLGMINKIHELKVALKQLEDNRNFEKKHFLH